MDRRWVALNIAGSRMAETVGFLVLASFLFAACSPGPGSAPPSRDAGASPATTVETAPVPGTTSPPEAAPSDQPALTSSPSPISAAEQALAASPQKMPPASAPSAAATPSKVVLAQLSVPAATVAPQIETKSPAPEPSATPAAAHAGVAVDIGGVVQVDAPKTGLTRVGVASCKLCHKVQFTSWAKTAHGTRVPPLDCESCHGPGSEYKSLAIMKDPKKARSAGLVIPGRAFCSRCHTSGWTDDLLKRAHAHKAGV